MLAVPRSLGGEWELLGLTCHKPKALLAGLVLHAGLAAGV